MDEMKTNLFEKFTRLQWLLQRQRMGGTMEHGPFADRSRGQGRVLALLKIQPEISSKELAYLLDIRQQSLNELLNRLEKGGYVERRPSEADKRVMMVHLTEKGKEVQQPETGFQNLFDCLNEEEQAVFGAYLDRIIAALEEQLGITPEETDEWMERARTSLGEDRFALLMHGMRRMHEMHGRRRGPGNGFDDFPPCGRNHGR